MLVDEEGGKKLPNFRLCFVLVSLGILIAKRKVFRNEIPQVPGGGTVEYVSRDDHSAFAS